MSRLPCALLFTALTLSTACINVPEVEPDPTPDGGTQPSTKFTLSLSPSEDSVIQGGSRAIQVSIVRAESFLDSVSVALEQPQSGVTAQPTTIPSGESTATLTVQVSANTAAGDTTLTVRATSGNEFRTAPLKLAVARAGDLIVRWTAPVPGDSDAYTNGALQLEATIEGGAAEAVEFRRDTELLARITAPPYTHTWNTQSAPEGEYQLTARAIRGGTTFTSLERTVVVDRTPPVVATRAPASSDSQVSARASLEATFSEPVRFSSISQDNVEVLAHGNTRLGAIVSLSSDGTRLTITPTAPLPVPSTVLVKLGTSTHPILDLAGNVLHSASEWVFTVPVWLPVGSALSAHAGATPSENAVLKMDADDRPTVAWSESDGTSKNIHVARWDGTTWQHLGSGLSGLAGLGTDAENPDLHIDAAGRVVVAWDEATGTEDRRRPFLKRWTSSTWEDLPALPRFDGFEITARTPKLATTPNGALFLYLVDSSNRLLGLTLAKDAVEWTYTNTTLPWDHFNPSQPAISVHGENVFVSYNTYLDSLERRGVAVLMNHQTALGSGLVPALPNHVASTSAIVTDQAGNPIVAWNTTDNATQEKELYFSQWTGTAWRTPVPVTATSSSNDSPSLALGTNHQAVLAWSGIVNSERVIHIARLQDDTWDLLSPPLSANATPTTPSLKPSLALDAMNHPTVAWQEGAGSGADIYVYRYNH
ncbi:Ig-like domain-containing protein [Myxococcus xanthus]|uniref:Ig-like domain-containing protein n=1 Tax=Myxococcus xanthus TaxID=34 RepID=UPI00137590B2|nr:Ig-like domain-containing protein [Myxococcus xanthus]